MLDKIVLGILPGKPLMLGYHRYTASARGELLHFTGADASADTLRAIVPPDGWADYCRQYPEAQSIVDQLTLLPSTKATLDAEAAKAAADAAAVKAAADAAIANAALNAALVSKKVIRPKIGRRRGFQR